MKEVAVLMATYNAGEYIYEQLDSILNQNYKDFDLYIHDDGSNDNTISIIKKYAQNNSNVFFIEDGISNKSANKNFLFLLNFIKTKKYKYICFSDQDDIWSEDHIDVLLNTIKTLPNNIPCLTHGDSAIVDSNNQLLNNSFNESCNVRMKREDVFSISLKNNCQGTSMMINSETLKYIDDNTEKIFMYDWYLSTLVSAIGKQIYIDKKIVRYRQHGNNVLGGQKTRKYISMLKINNLKNYVKLSNKELEYTNNQLESIIKTTNNENAKKIVECLNSNLLKRICFCLKYRIIQNGGTKLFFKIIFKKKMR